MEVFASLDEESQEAMRSAFEKSETAEEFVNRVMVGDCPSCGSADVGDCGEDPEIRDNCVGRCYACGKLWCLECGEIFENKQTSCGCSAE